jgi:putative glutathione S-transferase
MGHLVEGKWTSDRPAVDSKGRFIRAQTSFRDRITADGSSGFPAEAGRYHLYVALACPWAHRTLITCRLKKLDGAIGISTCEALLGENGWHFSEGTPDIPDGADGPGYLKELYVHARSDYTGRVSVPVLWDRKRQTIVNNESREIIRMLDHELDAFGDASVDLCPAELAEDVEREIDAMYESVNNGVYRAGFARTQEAHEEAVRELFNALDRYESRLSKQRYLCGSRLTEADICLFTTLVRFDPVYHYLFKCNLGRLRDYDNVWNYTKDVFQTPGIGETVDLDHIKQHYFRSMESINPTRIVPAGPLIDYTEPHDRARFG